MRRTVLICDNCGKDNLESYIEIAKGLVQRGSGKQAGTLVGYYVDLIDDKLFCSITCLDTYINSKIAIKYGSRWDRWELGEEPEPKSK